MDGPAEGLAHGDFDETTDGLINGMLDGMLDGIVDRKCAMDKLFHEQERYSAPMYTNCSKHTVMFSTKESRALHVSRFKKVSKFVSPWPSVFDASEAGMSQKGEASTKDSTVPLEVTVAITDP